MMAMPNININNIELSDGDRNLVREILKADNTLYQSKPKNASRDGQYLWRVVAFGISPNSQHHKLPTKASRDLNGNTLEQKSRARELHQLALQIEQAVPVTERHGSTSWYRQIENLNNNRFTLSPDYIYTPPLKTSVEQTNPEKVQEANLARVKEANTQNIKPRDVSSGLSEEMASLSVSLEKAHQDNDMTTVARILDDMRRLSVKDANPHSIRQKSIDPAMPKNETSTRRRKTRGAKQSEDMGKAENATVRIISKSEASA